MKYLYAFLVSVLISTFVLAQSDDSRNWGIGLRFGDPAGITLKKYSSKSALEFSIGRTYTWYGRGWYNNSFNGWYNGKKYNYPEIQYLGYHSTFPLGIQAHYLFLNPITSSEGIFEWYYGAGAQLRFQTISYDYRYKINGDPNWYYQYNDRYTNLDIGLDAVIGIEYTFKSAPISVFLDTGIFVEIIDQPFVFWGIGGVGVRYNL